MKIFVTRQLPGNHLESLSKAGIEYQISQVDRPLTQQELVDKVPGIDGIISLLTDRIDGDLMDTAGPQLKIISNYAVGFDNVNIKAATDRGIVVTNTPSEEVNEAVAEHAWALILASARRVVEADEATRRGAYRGWEPDIFLGTSLVGKTLGILGLGRIGSMVAKRAAGFGMKIIYNKRSRDEQAENEFGCKFADLETLLKDSDVITLHVPLTDETRHIINKESLAKMKKGSYLINTARGGCVDEHALGEAVREGRLAGAALDVFDCEPNIDPELIGMQNIILTPHIASSTKEAREKMGQQAIGAIIDILSDKKPDNIVNEEMWNNRRK